MKVLITFFYSMVVIVNGISSLSGNIKTSSPSSIVIYNDLSSQIMSNDVYGDKICWICVRIDGSMDDTDISLLETSKVSSISSSSSSSSKPSRYSLPKSPSHQQIYPLTPYGPVVVFSGNVGAINGAIEELKNWMLEGQRRAATRLSSPSSHIISSQSTGWEPVPYSSPPFNPTVERTAEILNTFTKHRHTGDNLHCLVVGDNTQASYPPFDIVDVLPNGVKRDWSKGGCTSIGR